MITSVPVSDYETIPLPLIREPEQQLRERIDPERLGELADSIAAEGLHQAIGVRGPLPDATYELIYGHRRYLAHKLLQRPNIAAKIYPADYDPLLARVSENLQRTDLTPVEEATALRAFLDAGQPVAACARLFRRSPHWIEERLALLDYPEDLRVAVHAGTLKLGVARALADVDYPPYRAELIQEAARTGATVATADVWRAHFLADRDRIVGNQVRVQEIIAARESYVVRYPCDWCGTEVPYPDTRTTRLCLGCTTDLEAAKGTA